MMKRALWLGIVASALALPGMGCEGGKSCQTLCEEANECPNVTMPVADCQQACTDRDKLVKAAECTTQQQEYNECVSALTDVCEASNICVTESKAIYYCLDDYCTANPTACGGT